MDAIGEYNPDTKECIVKKGSKVSAEIAYSEKFRGVSTISLIPQVETTGRYGETTYYR